MDFEFETVELPPIPGRWKTGETHARALIGGVVAAEITLRDCAYVDPSVREQAEKLLEVMVGANAAA